MYLADLRSILLRRWYAVVVGVLVTLAACGAVASLVGPTYESRASIVLVPGTGTIVEGGNPLLYLGGLGQARDVLVKSLESERVVTSLRDRHPSATIDVYADSTSSGPLVVVEVAATSAASAQGALSDMLSIISAELIRLQDAVGAPEHARMSPLTLTADTEPEKVQKQRLRAVAGTLAAGIAFTLVCTSAIDGLARVARARQRSRRLSAPLEARSATQSGVIEEEVPDARVAVRGRE